MKHAIVWTILAILIISACTFPAAASPSSASSSKAPARSCGDGVCSGPEDAKNCPADCSSVPASGTSAKEKRSTASSASTAQGEAPLFMTTMTHMEGNFNDDKKQDVFLLHVKELRYAMDLAQEYGAILTIESEKPFARANTIWNVNIMAEIRDRGFGVGTHCDIGFNEPPMPVNQFSAMFAENKALVDALIGSENNLGCSGGGSVNDWALAASQAGFKYLDGIVSMHYLSMPIKNRPDPVFTDAFIRDGHFHLNAPVDLYQRIYPFAVANADDFLPDENPVIVVSSGELGLFSAIAEKGREYNGGPILHDDEYVFDNADVDALVTKITEVNQNRDRTRVAKLCVYLPAVAYAPENEKTLRYFFEQIKTLQDQGAVTWATQRHVYEAYKEWNSK
jgi:hypothetical protein